MAEHREELIVTLHRQRNVNQPQQQLSRTVLGEMEADQLASTTMDRLHRTRRRVTVKDAAAAEEATRVFELLMGNEVAPRKEFIVAGDGFDKARIDA